LIQEEGFAKVGPAVIALSAGYPLILRDKTLEPVLEQHHNSGQLAPKAMDRTSVPIVWVSAPVPVEQLG
jgi:hypothetical protein